MHIDNSTQDTANDFISNSEIPISIFNYDTISIDKIRKPNYMKSLILVVLKKANDFSDYLEFYNSIHPNDYVIFITNTNKSDNGNLETISNLDKSSGVIIANYDDNSVEISTICYYCGADNRKARFREKLSQESKAFFPNSKNFKTHQFKIGYMNYFPYIYCLEKTRIGNKILCNKAVGSEYDLLTSLSQTLNFTFQLIEAEESDYNILMNQIFNGILDFAIGGISATTERIRNNIRFSSVLRFEKLALMFVYQKSIYSRLLYYQSFGHYISVLIATTIIFLALVLYFLLKHQVPFQTVLLDVLRIILEQPLPFKNLSKRLDTPILLILASWWIFCIIINAIYKSKLSSLMVLRPPQRTTLEELVEEGYQIAMDRTKTYLQMFLDEEEVLINRPTTVWKSSRCDLLSYVQENKALIPGEISLNLLHYRVECPPDKSEENWKKLTAQTIAVTPHVWAFKPGATFVDIFNVHIKEVMSAGLLKKWKKDVLLKQHFSTYLAKIEDKSETNVLHFEQFLLEFIMYLVFITISIFCFLAEVAYHVVIGRQRKILF